MYSSNSRIRTVHCSSKKSSWSGSWLIILSSSIFISSVFYTDQLLFIWHLWCCGHFSGDFLNCGCSLEAIPYKIKLCLKWCKHCSLELYGAILFIGFLSWHRFVLNLEIRPSFVLCWRWRGHQSRLKSAFFKLYSARGISQQHKSTFFTSLSMELTLGQASLALGRCGYYR